MLGKFLSSLTTVSFWSHVFTELGRAVLLTLGSLVTYYATERLKSLLPPVVPSRSLPSSGGVSYQPSPYLPTTTTTRREEFPGFVR